MSLDIATIRQGIADGRQVSQIADDLGVTKRAVYWAADQSRLPIRRGHIRSAATLRAAVQDMNKAAAVDYLLEVAEQLIGQDEPLPQVIGGVKIRPQQAIIFALLNRHIGQTVTRERILTAIAAGRPDDAPSWGSINQQIFLMRRLLAGQYDIATICRYGYRMEAIA